MKEEFPPKKLNRILRDAADGKTLSHDQAACLLRLKRQRDITSLHRTAREIRSRHFGSKVFLYGFLNFSTYCRNDCRFCGYRRSSGSRSRYRKEMPEIVECATKLAESGVHLLDLTAGEDPLLFKQNGASFGRILELVQKVKGATGLPIMVSPGAAPDDTIVRLRQHGADWFACYQETHNRALFKTLRIGQDYDRRLQKKILAKNSGLFVEEGLLRGVGESVGDILTSLDRIKVLGADQVRVMTFVPQKGTPMGNETPPDDRQELIDIAVLRLIFPDRLIPASLDVKGLAGLKARLDAGANVVTSIVPPGKGLAGVAQRERDIENSGRSVRNLLPVVEECGLEPASVADYRNWIENRRKL